MRLKDEVAIITGSTKGIGRAMAHKFAAEGARVLVTGRSEDLGAEVARDIVARGGDACYVRADINEERQVKGLVDEAVGRYGKLTVLVNNAASTEMLTAGPDHLDDGVEDLSTEAWDTIIKNMLTSAFWGCKYAIPEMKRAGGSSIVNISSYTSVLGVPGVTAYSVAKAGMHGLTRAVAVDAAPHAVRCNCINVGIVLATEDAHSPMSQFADVMRSLQVTRLGVPDDIANLTAFLASREAEFLTGVVMAADGGATAKMPLPSSDVVERLSEASAQRWERPHDADGRATGGTWPG